MQTLERVNIDDVYPYEAQGLKMNQRDFAKRETQAYIDVLAEQFKANRLNPGEPYAKPILYRDGGIYQIIDGECRYNAMKRCGTKSFWAEVYDDLDEAETARQEAAKAMVATDSKLALTPEELSRSVQLMLELDVPDEDVAAVSKIEAGKVKRARRAAKALDDAAYDMTIDRLIAIDEFSGDPDAVAQLSSCEQREWQGVYAQLCRKRDHDELVARVVEECRRCGVEVVDEQPEGMHHRASKYLTDALDEIEALAVEAGEGCKATVGGMWLELFGETAPEEPAPDPEEEARKAARERFREGWEAGCAARAAWVAGRVAEPERMPQTADLLMDAALDRVSGFTEPNGIELPPEPSGIGLCLGFTCVSWPVEWSVCSLVDGGTCYQDRAKAALAREVYGAMVRDGYEPNEEEARGFAALASWLEEE